MKPQRIPTDCQDSNCGGYLTHWMHGASGELYYCETCGQVYRWADGKMRLQAEWIIPTSQRTVV